MAVMAVESLAGRERLVRLLRGDGIEIGALHRPVHAPHLRVKHVDRMTRAELLTHYPELAAHPVVDPDIIDDAERLASIADNSQDFVIANHVIEHMRDPIGALLQWQRVLKPKGRLFLAAPDKRATFDAPRPLTTIEHLVADHQAPSHERDFEAFREFALHVSCRTFKVKPEAEAESFARHLAEIDYSIHFHVWTEHTFRDFLVYLDSNLPEWNMRVVDSVPMLADEFAFVLEKRGRGWFGWW